MVKESSLGLMVENMKENGRTGYFTVKVQSLYLMERSMLGIGRIIKNTVKEHTLFLIEVSMQVSSEGTNLGTSHFTTKT